MTLNIYDGDRTIRTPKQKAPDSVGVYSMRWSMDEKGGDRPFRTIGKRSGEPSGVCVKPGVYKITVSYGDLTSSETITVANDPRLPKDERAINAIYNAEREIEDLQQIAADAVEALIKSRTTVKDFENRLKKEDDRKFKDAIKSSKEIVKNIDANIDRFLGKKDERQGVTRDPDMDIMHRFYLASSYISSRPNGLNRTEHTLLAQAKKDLQEGLEAVNEFYEVEWKAYKTEMSNLEFTPFEEVKKFGT